MVFPVRRITRGAAFALCVLCAVLVAYGQDRDVARAEREYDVRLAQLRLEAPLHYALGRRDYDAALKAMPLATNINASVADVHGIPSPAICLAAQDDSADAYDMVQALVKRYGAELGLRDGRGLTALHYAAFNGNLPVVELLVDHGADVDAPQRGEESEKEARDETRTRITPLYLAYHNGRYRVARLLESRGAKPLAGQALIEAKLSGALAEGYRTARADVPEGLTPLEAVRFEQDIATHRAQEFLTEHNLHEEATILKAYGDKVVDLIEGVPFPESEHPAALAAWMREIQVQAWAALQEQFPALAVHGGTDAPD